MDPLRLLSRSTKLSKNQFSRSKPPLPSNGQNANPQLFSNNERKDPNSPNGTRKRKRGGSAEETSEIEFFARSVLQGRLDAQEDWASAGSESGRTQSPSEDTAEDTYGAVDKAKALSLEERKQYLQKHKLKVTWLNPRSKEKKKRRKGKAQSKGVSEKQSKVLLFPHVLETFGSLQSRFGISNRLASNIHDQGYTIPTEVQLGALPLLLDRDLGYSSTGNTTFPMRDATDGVDLLTVAPTGSGKTLAFLIPLVQHTTEFRRSQQAADKATSVVILAPTKELVGQIVNEGKKLTNGTGIRISQVRKGMRLGTESSTSINGSNDPETDPSSERCTVVRSDILVSTPGILDSIIRTTSNGDRPLSMVRCLVLDEADVLLDPLFREQTLAIWDALSVPNLRVSLWSATMGSNIEELAREQINRRQKSLTEIHGHELDEAPLIRLVVGLKDSAVPNIQHKLTYAASEQGKLMSLRQILHPTTSTADAGSTLLPPFLVFTQTIERAIALHAELLYDIPPEAGGISRIAVLHADLSDAARARVMARFRAADIWVLITTDLLSRGVDFRGVNAVINYDIPTSSAAYVHRVGRTGRAGRMGGVAITLYSKDDVPYLRNIANVIAAAQKQRGAVGGDGDGDGVQPWLLDALPSLSKQVKRDLKRRGVESRAARGREKDPKAARQARISTKAGFVRREENRRQGAIAGSRRRQEDEGVAEDDASATDFDGFDA